MKIRLYESLIEVIIALGVGIPLILGGALDTWENCTYSSNCDIGAFICCNS